MENGGLPLPDPKALEPHLKAVWSPVQVVHETGVAPLEHAHARLEEVTLADAQLAT